MNTNIDERTEVLARRMYDVYTAAVGGKAWDGRPLPSSAEFFADESKRKQADGWRAAAEQCKSVELVPGSFGWALEWMKKGKGVRRNAWEAGEMLYTERANKEGVSAHPYFFHQSAKGGLFPWRATPFDLLANDWETID